MRSKKYLWEICMNIYQQMYREADPPLDFRQAIKDGITAEKNWFLKYYLPTKRQQEIVDFWCKKHKCSKIERKAIEYEIWLGSSPNGIKKEE